MICDRSLWHDAKMIYTEYKINEPTCDKNIKKNSQHDDLEEGYGLPIFVRDFKAETNTDTKLMFSSLGCVDIWINGRRIGNDEMKPGWTDYDKRTFYYEYNVTDYIRIGSNRILAVLSGGWYSGRISGDYYGCRFPAFIACLSIGDKSIVTDTQWKTFVGGQIRTADIWDGEYRDSRKDGFDVMSQPIHKIKSLKNAKICNYFHGEVTKAIGPKVQVRNELCLTAKSITVYDGVIDNNSDYGEINVISTPKCFPINIKKGQKAIIDLGQEMVGWANIKIKGNCGTKFKMRYAEFLNDSGLVNRGNDGAKGSVYTINMRSAKTKAYYVLSGVGEEVYRPTFTFFGFRYVELSADKDIEILDFISEVVGSVTPETGHIETSDSLVNKLISNVIWGQRSNYLSVPTDCPQRDERLGWTGDAQVFSRTAAYNANVLGFFHKWMQDMRDAQSDEGAYPDVAPRVGCCTSENAAAWADAGVIIPYTMYIMFGDKSIIEEHYDSMDRYISQLVKVNGLTGPIPRYGDWLAYDCCKNEFLSSAYFIYDIELMIRMSKAIGRDGKKYIQLKQEAYNYFKSEFMKDGKLIGTTQTDYAVSLLLDLIDGEYADEVADKLVEKIRENGNRLSTGFIGTYCLCLALSKMGKDNMAYTLLLQREEPSWLYSVEQGATTVWERWNSYTHEKGFGDVGMNSFNHYAYGAIEEWMYRYMAGIETDGPGFKKILLQPRIDTRTDAEIPEGQNRITWVKASYNSIQGLIKSEWHNGSRFIYECTVPEKAKLLLPIFSDEVRINGEKHKMNEFQNENNCAVILINSGKYIFEE